MTTSGQTILSLTRDDLVNAALRKVSTYARGVALDAQEYTDATTALNAMLLGFETKGMPLWKRTVYSFSLTAGTSSYTIGIGQTVAIPAPLKLYKVFNLNSSSGSPIEATIESINDFKQLNRSTTGGIPVSVCYIPGINTGVLEVWPQPTAASIVNTSLEIHYHKPFDMFVAATDTADFPQYWYEAVIYGLAWRLAPEYQVPLNDRKEMEHCADKFLEMALEFGSEEASLFFSPDRTRG